MKDLALFLSEPWQLFMWSHMRDKGQMHVCSSNLLKYSLFCETFWQGKKTKELKSGLFFNPLIFSIAHWAWERESFLFFRISFLADGGQGQSLDRSVRVKTGICCQCLPYFVPGQGIFCCCNNLQVTVYVWPTWDEVLVHCLPPMLLHHLHLDLAKMEVKLYLWPRLPSLSPWLLWGGKLPLCLRPTLLGPTRRRCSCTQLPCSSLTTSTKSTRGHLGSTRRRKSSTCTELSCSIITVQCSRGNIAQRWKLQPPKRRRLCKAIMVGPHWKARTRSTRTKFLHTTTTSSSKSRFSKF